MGTGVSNRGQKTSAHPGTNGGTPRRSAESHTTRREGQHSAETCWASHSSNGDCSPKGFFFVTGMCIVSSKLLRHPAASPMGRVFQYVTHVFRDMP